MRSCSGLGPAWWRAGREIVCSPVFERAWCPSLGPPSGLPQQFQLQWVRMGRKLRAPSEGGCRWWLVGYWCGQSEGRILKFNE
eukprot:scaffold12970_cov113-Isochrysis_galbana.AAC.3